MSECLKSAEGTVQQTTELDFFDQPGGQLELDDDSIIENAGFGHDGFVLEKSLHRKQRTEKS